MTLKDKINQDLKTALLGGDKLKSGTLRELKAVVLNEEVAQGKRDEGLDDMTIEKLIVREVKKRNESATIYEEADRSELALNERSEANVLSQYLPEQLSEADIEKVVERVIKEQGADNISAIGKTIGFVKKELGNSADGALIAKIVKNKLI